MSPTRWPSPTADGSLSRAELTWMSLYEFLHTKGYRLRARYHPNWHPSWIGSDVTPEYIREHHLEGDYEDILPILCRGEALDATKVEDGKPVWLKMLLSTGEELSILRTMSQKDLRFYPHNHCVSILDVFDVPDTDGKYSIAVQPMLRTWYDPPLHLFVEAIAVIDQILEGLAFMHSLKVTHGDIMSNNIMMNADAMFPDSFNPLVVGRSNRSFVLPDATPLGSRLEVPVKYIYIDFGSGRSFRSDEEPPLVIWNGGFSLMPEIYETYLDATSSRTRPYDPFKADVWALGYFFYGHFMRPCMRRFPVLDALILNMLQHDPLSCPSAAESLRQFRDATASLSWSLCYRFPPFRMISWGYPREEREKVERDEAQEYFRYLLHFLYKTAGEPRLLDHM
ncbi:hypothetical protein PENSPDRAFT_759081 [Peniophora sp. CONT]|nr:hypothetical protein PENSPDRAFT_759081 [Peniophora sp. CONT]